jgi:hypothetical protein
MMLFFVRWGAKRWTLLLVWDLCKMEERWFALLSVGLFFHSGQWPTIQIEGRIMASKGHWGGNFWENKAQKIFICSFEIKNGNECVRKQ